MFSSRKGDDGNTELMGHRIPKCDIKIEVLGELDELSSFLGLCKVRCREKGRTEREIDLELLLDKIQSDIFLIQANLAGFKKELKKERSDDLEDHIRSLEENMTPLRGFITPGDNEISACFDIARSVTRRAERRIVELDQGSEEGVDMNIKSYINRLSDLLFMMARSVE
ncbi:MAG: cob(I)yrinic acid a,c-diamide adenosyltransferase [Candidatus Paceibacterota bacterium]